MSFPTRSVPKNWFVFSMVVFLLHIKIRDAFRRINPDLRISAARFDYEVVFSLLFP